jgi:hypothetical protein
MRFIRFLFYSFPVRLIVLHLRNHLMLVSLWVLMALFACGVLGSFFGVHYLLLTPEYLGRVDFWSFALVGIAAGWFFMTWNLTSYLLVSNRFPFLATLKAPFTKFCINNSIIPMLFFVFYIGYSISFQWYFELTSAAQIAWNICGFWAGFGILVFVLSGYFFFTNKDIYTFLNIGKIVPREGARLLAPGQRVPTLSEIQTGNTQYRCDFYLNERAKWRAVRDVAHYNRAILEQVFRQNHTNAVVVQVTSMLVLMGLGLFMEQAWARIPTGATIFILGALMVAAFGALIFWFRHWAMLTFLVIAVLLNYLTGLELFNYRSRAIGLTYPAHASEHQPYTYANLQSMCTDSIVDLDKKNTLAILENWAKKNKTEGKKPKMVLLCFSGGGLRSAQWSFQNLMQLNALTDGKLYDQTMLVTGASGGMYGATWFRNLAQKRTKQEVLQLANQPDYLLKCSEDLLNPITFAIISNDLFFPLTRVQIGKNSYRRDRGYMLEKALLDNSEGLLGGNIGDYAAPEAKAEMPMMIYSPFILNDGRKLLIGAQGLSYLMVPPQSDATKGLLEIDAVDFRRIFADNAPDSLRVTSALRMNSTFPLILPNVWLPTKPAMEIMDAGVRDNYGISTSARFVHTFSDWIKENTSGVVVVQMRSWTKIAPIKENDHKGVIEDLIGKASVAGLMTQIEDFRQDNDLALLNTVLGPEMLEIVRFEYQPLKKESEASLSFHLSKRESLDILNAYYRPENLRQAERLKALLNR